MSLTLSNVSRSVNGEVHLDNVSMSFEAGSFNVLLGRTLSGKTSLMRLIAGLDRPDSGEVHMDGKNVVGVPVQKRNVSMVYQQFINYPHLTVFDNIASPLKIAGQSASLIKGKVTEIAELLHIQELLQRYPLELSGGQQQRTAMARALVKDSSLILFDEPLANLDYKLREELRTELRDLFRERKTIVVYATTEPAEALALGGCTSLLHQGRLVQSGPVNDVYSQPATLIAAELFSEPSLNVVSGAAHGQSSGLLLGIRPEHVSLSRGNGNDLELEVVVDVAEISGSETFLHMRNQHFISAESLQDKSATGQEIIARLRGVHAHEPGDCLTVYLPEAKLFNFAKDGKTIERIANG